jgi:4-hydroxy-tetrahydrodipicolinate synthase
MAPRAGARHGIQHTCPRFPAASNIAGYADSAPPLFNEDVQEGKRLSLSGSITALATPFTDAGELDLDAWRRLLKRQIDGGTQGVVVAGSTGEAAALEMFLTAKRVSAEEALKSGLIDGISINPLKTALELLAD